MTASVYGIRFPFMLQRFQHCTRRFSSMWCIFAASIGFMLRFVVHGKQDSHLVSWAEGSLTESSHLGFQRLTADPEDEEHHVVGNGNPACSQVAGSGCPQPSTAARADPLPPSTRAHTPEQIPAPKRGAGGLSPPGFHHSRQQETFFSLAQYTDHQHEYHHPILKATEWGPPASRRSGPVDAAQKRILFTVGDTYAKPASILSNKWKVFQDGKSRGGCLARIKTRMSGDAPTASASGGMTKQKKRQEYSAGPKGPFENCPRDRLRAAASVPALFQNSGTTRNAAEPGPSDSPRPVRVRQGGGAVPEEFGYSPEYVEEFVPGHTHEEMGKASKGWQKHAQRLVTSIFSKSKLMQQVERNEAIATYFSSIETLTEELQCVKVHPPGVREDTWDAFCQQFAWMPELHRVCLLYRDYLTARLREAGDCEGINIVECLLRLKLPLVQPFLTHILLNTTGGSAATSPVSRLSAELSVGWGVAGMEFIGSALLSIESARNLVTRTASCVFARVWMKEQRDLLKRERTRLRTASELRRARRASILMALFAAAMPVKVDGMLVHLTLGIVNESDCPNLSRRGGNEKVTLEGPRHPTQVSRKELFEYAIQKSFIVALVPTPNDCATQEGGAASHRHAWQSADHNCEVIVQSKRLTRTLYEAASHHEAGVGEEAADINNRVSRDLRASEVYAQEDDYTLLEEEVILTIMQARRSRTRWRRFLNALAKRNWLSTLIAALLALMMRLRSQPADHDTIRDLAKVPNPKLLVAYMAREAAAQMLCSTGLEGLENIVDKFMQKLLLRQMKKAQAALRTGSISPPSMIARAEQPSTKETDNSLRRSTGAASLAEVTEFGTCSRQRPKQLLPALTRKAEHLQISHLHADNGERDGTGYRLANTQHRTTRGRGVPSAAFVECRGNGRRGSRWALPTIAILGAVGAALVAFSYAGPVITVVVVVVGLVLGVALFFLVPVLKRRLQEHAAAKPPSEEELKPLVPGSGDET